MNNKNLNLKDKDYLIYFEMGNELHFALTKKVVPEWEKWVKHANVCYNGPFINWVKS